MVEAVILVVFPFCMLFAALSDWVSMTIANRVSVILVVTFAVIAPMTGMAWPEIGMHFAAAGLVLAVTFGLFAMGTMGGGDAKLLSATALWMGWNLSLVEYLAGSAVLGGILTMVIISFRSTALSYFVTRSVFFRNFTQVADGVPYGIALGVAGLITFPSSPLMLWTLGRLTAI